MMAVPAQLELPLRSPQVGAGVMVSCQNHDGFYWQQG